MGDENNIQRDTAKLAWDRYKSLSEKIRGWLLIYGVSILALFVTQAEALPDLTTTRIFWILGPAFLGVTIQLLLVISIKYCNLITFKAHFSKEPLKMDSKAHVWAKWWAEAFWIDIIADLFTVVAYGVASFVLAFSVAANTDVECVTCSKPSLMQGATIEHQEKSREEEGEDKEKEESEENGKKEESEEKGKEEIEEISNPSGNRKMDRSPARDEQRG